MFQQALVLDIGNEGTISFDDFGFPSIQRL